MEFILAYLYILRSLFFAGGEELKALFREPKMKEAIIGKINNSAKHKAGEAKE